jgi:hypothetical protein
LSRRAAPAYLGCYVPGRQREGDKAGDWQGWYRAAIPLAETDYADHLRRTEEKGGNLRREHAGSIAGIRYSTLPNL